MTLIETLTLRDHDLTIKIRQRQSAISDNIQLNRIWKSDIIAYKKELIEINAMLTSMGYNGSVKE